MHIICIHVIAQYQVYGSVEYDFIINNPNGVSFANPYLLYFNNQKSFYIKNGESRRIREEEKNNSNFINGKVIEEKIMKSSLPANYVYTNLVDDTWIFREEIVQKMYTVKNSIKEIKWKLLKERKMIGNYDCQKAIGSFRGREYTVWFTTEIPISHGP